MGQAETLTAAPQLPQNRAPGATAAWHLGQVDPAAAGLPQLAQNLAPAGSGVWHLGHGTPVGAVGGRG